MKNLSKMLLAAIVTSSAALAAVASPASAADTTDRDEVMSVRFEPRRVVKVEAGDFHFKPGQLAPVHTHAAPALSYIVKGAIIAQVEGEEPVFLKEGDVFYEPAGPRILRYDNASPTEEAIFIDINLQQEGEPFIVFPKPPTEDIDRRAMPGTTYESVTVDGAEIYSHSIQPDAKQYVDTSRPTTFYVADGVVDVRVNGKASQRLESGALFHQYTTEPGTVLINASSDAPAKVIVFSLHTAS